MKKEFIIFTLLALIIPIISSGQVIVDNSSIEDELEDLFGPTKEIYLSFDYDDAGNQFLKRKRIVSIKDIIIPYDNITENNDILVSEQDLSSKFYIAPNPTSGLVYLSWDNDLVGRIISINITSMNNGEIIPVKFAKGDVGVEINLTNFNPGIYIVRYLLSTGEIVQSKIIRSIN